MARLSRFQIGSKLLLYNRVRIKPLQQADKLRPSSPSGDDNSPRQARSGAVGQGAGACLTSWPPVYAGKVDLKVFHLISN
jgi:hypothetical protein